MNEQQYYIRIYEDKTFGFVVDGIHDILENDIAISKEDYNTFFVNQSEGKYYRVKSRLAKTKGLFGCVEEYVPEVIPYTPTEEEQQALDQNEYLMELDLRITNLELGLTE